MKKSINVNYVPIEHEDWWRSHVNYFVFDRQGIDIICAEFHHPNPKANIILLTGWNESFLKYPELIKILFDARFSIFTYDHQSQGLSGRWLAEQQSTWVHSFNDYVDDFVSYANTIVKEYAQLPIYVIAHSMGCLIAAIGMSRHPGLINRAVLSAPMFRNKCGMKIFNFQYPLPQPIVHFLSYCLHYAGLGFLHAIGYYKENPNDPITAKYTTDKDVLKQWERLRQRYPNIISPCVTNDWILQSLRAQIEFSRRYELVRTNCLIFQAEDQEDVFVYNRAMSLFTRKAPAARIFKVPGAYHELFSESKIRRNAIFSVIMKYFSQISDDVKKIDIIEPLQEINEWLPIFSFSEVIIRAVGAIVAAAGIIAGLTLMITGRRRY